MKDHNCLECGRELYGRVDKKFCSDACRNAYNNKVNAISTPYIRRVNKRLKKNRTILEKLNPGGMTRTHREKLMKEGFDFDFFTNIYMANDRNIFRFCYEHGYLVLEGGFVLLVKCEG